MQHVHPTVAWSSNQMKAVAYFYSLVNTSVNCVHTKSGRLSTMTFLLHTYSSSAFEVRYLIAGTPRDHFLDLDNDPQSRSSKLTKIDPEETVRLDD